MMNEFIDFDIVYFQKSISVVYDLKVFSYIFLVFGTQLSPFAGFVRVSYLQVRGRPNYCSTNKLRRT